MFYNLLNQTKSSISHTNLICLFNLSGKSNICLIDLQKRYNFSFELLMSGIFENWIEIAEDYI